MVSTKGAYQYPLSKEVKELKKMMLEWQAELGREKPDTIGVKKAIDDYLSNWDNSNLGLHVKTPY